MIAIKIGGSLLESKKIRECLDIIVAQNKRTFIIPGGGVFANLVRSEQKKIKFNNLVAHNLCLLSMSSVGCIIQSMIPKSSELIVNVDELHLTKKNITVWVPKNKFEVKCNKFTNWNTTSDTIALTTSKKINAKTLIILKACEIPDSGNQGYLKISKKKGFMLSEKKILDKKFYTEINDCNFPIFIIYASKVESLTKLLRKF
ncbi:MAG: hypothetical protein CBD16_06940 [Betaproteobacteria bacterium TMED156]|nr:MAG: hypothetical protein CBD16_06940 [Betaproteobacteria bacterium TMED156]|tara:strand:+ start:883 stop:1488 length:606 start_codon:yes stop_codon:yes gene_type:complete